MEPKSAKSDHHNPVTLGVDVNQQAALGLLSDFWTGSTSDPTEADQMLVTLFNQSLLQGWGVGSCRKRRREGDDDDDGRSGLDSLSHDAHMGVDVSGKDPEDGPCPMHV